MKLHRRHWRAAILAAAILTALTLGFPLGAKPVPKLVDKLPTIRCDFRDKQFDASAFEFSGKNAEEFILKEPEGLRITLPAANGPGKPIGIALRHKVRGDFEIEAAVEIINLPMPPARLAAGITIYGRIDKAPRPGFFVGKMRDQLKGPILHAGLLADLAKGRDVAFERKLETKPDAGQAHIRLVRRNGKLEFMAREKDARAFTLLGSMDVVNEDVEFLRLAAESGERTDHLVDVRILYCSIQAKEFLPLVPDAKK